MRMDFIKAAQSLTAISQGMVRTGVTMISRIFISAGLLN
jgi:hypothetical protein